MNLGADKTLLWWLRRGSDVIYQLRGWILHLIFILVLGYKVFVRGCCVEVGVEGNSTEFWLVDSFQVFYVSISLVLRTNIDAGTVMVNTEYVLMRCGLGDN